MTDTHLHRSTLLALVALVSILLPPLAPAAAQDRLSWTTCDTAIANARARCGMLSVLEDRTRPAGRRIDIAFSVLRATGTTRSADPVLVLLGGPGDAASRRIAGLAAAHAAVNVERDLVLVDQRGTGRSASLACFLGSDDDLQSYLNAFMPLRDVRDCLARLHGGSDPARYRTTDFIADLEALRVALGIARWNLHGNSYGTRVALQYMARHPAAIRSAVLIGAVPRELVMPVSFGADADRALRLVLADCRADSTCASAFPNVAAELDSVAKRLERAPASADVVHPVSRAAERVAVSRGTFGEVVRATLYTPAGARMLPLMIHEAFGGDYAAIAIAALRRQRSMAREGWAGLYLAVTCAEDIARADRAAAFAANRATILGEFRARQHFDACATWPLRPDGDEWPATDRVTTPTLLIVGDQDPVTPPRWSETTMRQLASGRMIVVPQGGHGFPGMVGAECLTALQVAFYASASAAGLDSGCIASMRRAPFVTKR